MNNAPCRTVIGEASEMVPFVLKFCCSAKHYVSPLQVLQWYCDSPSVAACGDSLLTFLAAAAKCVPGVAAGEFLRVVYLLEWFKCDCVRCAQGRGAEPARD